MSHFRALTLGTEDLGEVTTKQWSLFSDVSESWSEIEEEVNAAFFTRMKCKQQIPVMEWEEILQRHIPENIKIKALLWNVMIQAGLSKTDLAKRIHKSEGYVRKLLDPRNNVTLSSLVEVAYALGKKIEFSLEGFSVRASSVSQEEINNDTFDKQKDAPGCSALISRNVCINSLRTSVRIEPELWSSLNEIAALEACSIHDLCTAIHELKSREVSFTSALRVFLVEYYKTVSRTTCVAPQSGFKEKGSKCIIINFREKIEKRAAGQDR